MWKSNTVIWIWRKAGLGHRDSYVTGISFKCSLTMVLGVKGDILNFELQLFLPTVSILIHVFWLL